MLHVSILQHGSKVFLDVSYSQLNGQIVTASADRHVRLWDPRVAGMYLTHSSPKTQLKCSRPKDGTVHYRNTGVNLKKKKKKSESV